MTRDHNGSDTAIREADYDAASSALCQVFAKAGKTRVLVVGDLMLDEFVFGAVQRISPEAPVPVVEITGRRSTPGGAANVAANVVALGGSASLAGVTGDDSQANDFHRLLASIHVDGPGIICDPGRPTTCKTRIIAGVQQIVRIDYESREAVPEEVESELIAAARNALKNSSTCVISDYGKGVVTRRLVTALVESASQRGIPVLVDPKGHDYRKYEGVSLITPNVKEAEMAAGHPIGNQDDLVRAARRIMRMTASPALLITQGASGMTLFRQEGVAVHSASLARQVFDVTGAGDTVVAMLALALGSGIGMAEAMLLANIAAGIAVEKPGTATVALEEIEEFLQASHHERVTHS